MKLLVLSLVGLSLALAPAPSRAEEDCALEYAKVSEARLAKPLAHLAEPYGTKTLIDRLRDSVRRRLQIIHEHAYPIIALDDATPVKAFSLAADNFGTLSAEQKALVNLDDIKKETEALISAAETFPQSKQAFLDDTATLVARADALDEVVAKGYKQNGYFTDLDMPKASVQADGHVNITMEKERFTDAAQLEIARNRARKTVNERLGQRFFGLNGLDHLVMDQATRIKKLETFYNEIDRQSRLAINQGKTLSPELQKFSDRVKALYASDNETRLKPEYSLPGWAWRKMRWLQLRSEVRSILQKDLPNLNTQVNNNQVIKFLKTLKPEELRAIGIGNLADSATVLGKTKWTQLFVTLAGSGTVAGAPTLYGLKSLYDLYVADAKAKELCAVQVNDISFQNCAVEYLQTKFPAKTIEQILANKDAFLSENGTIADPRVAKEVQDMLKRRKRYYADQNFRNNSKEALSKAILKIMRVSDPASAAYRQGVVETKEQDAFNMILLGNETPKVASYLQFRFPAEFPRYKKEVQEILAADYNSPEQRADIQKLKDLGAESLGIELNSLIQDHQNFLRGLAYHSSSSIPPTGMQPPVVITPTQPGTVQPGTTAPGTAPSGTHISPIIPGSVSPSTPGTTAPSTGVTPVIPTWTPPSSSNSYPPIPPPSTHISPGITVPITIPGFQQ